MIIGGYHTTCRAVPLANSQKEWMPRKIITGHSRTASSGTSLMPGREEVKRAFS
jgi:hypothetical protein